MKSGDKHVPSPRLLATVVFFLLLLFDTAAFAVDPLSVVREFCRADGLGSRWGTRDLPRIEHLIDWSLEPAWDRVAVIKGYEIATPRQEGNILLVDVTYTVVAETSASETARKRHLETRTFRLGSHETSTQWRILGPPPIPHVFETHFDVEAIAAVLDPHADRYLSNSTFVWRMLHDTGWTLPYVQTADLANASILAATDTPESGDLAFYFDGGRAYHVGFVEGTDLVVSATLNAGIRRTPLSAFSGERRFLRLVGNRPRQETPTGEESDATESLDPEPAPDTPTSG